MSQPTLKPLRSRLILFTLVRAVLNTGFRMVYPFMPHFARALGVDLQAIATAVSARSALGLAGPLIGSAGDRIGRKTAMLLGMGLFIGGMSVVVFWPTYTTFFLALLLGAAGKILFDPGMQAHLGDHVPYSLRGRSIAITEFGWSGAALLGLPVMGWVISRFGWLAPFPILAASASILLLILWRTIPDKDSSEFERISLKGSLCEITRSPTALAALLIVLLTSIGNEVVTVIYGAWLEESFALRAATLGAASAAIGLAELSGEGLVAGFTDRIGKLPAIVLGLCLILITSLILPLLSQNLTGALIGIFLYYLTFEFTFVSIISLMTELMPSSRATLLASNLSAAAGGRAIGAFFGPQLFLIGLPANALVSAGLALLALGVIVVELRKRPWSKNGAAIE